MFKLIIPLLIFVLPVGLPDRVVAQKVTVENVSSIVVGKWTPMLRPIEVGDRVLVQWMACKEDAEGYGYCGDLYRSDGVPLELALDLPTRFLYAAGDELYGVDTAPVDKGELNPHIVIYRLADDYDP